MPYEDLNTITAVWTNFFEWVIAFFHSEYFIKKFVLSTPTFYMGVSEWLLFNANSRREHVNFQWDDDDEVRFVLDQHSELDFYSASSLKQWSAGKHVTLLGHIILILSPFEFFCKKKQLWRWCAKDNL